MEDGKVKLWSQSAITNEMLENAPRVEPTERSREILRLLERRGEAVELMERIKRAKGKYTKGR